MISATKILTALMLVASPMQSDQISDTISDNDQNDQIDVVIVPRVKRNQNGRFAKPGDGKRNRMSRQPIQFKEENGVHYMTNPSGNWVEIPDGSKSSPDPLPDAPIKPRKKKG